MSVEGWNWGYYVDMFDRSQNIVGQHWIWGRGYGGTAGVSWMRDGRVGVDKRVFLWRWEGRVESELMTGDWREGWGRAVSFAFWSAALL